MTQFNFQSSKNKVTEEVTYQISRRISHVANTGQRVTAALDAPSRSLQIFHEHHLLKTVPLNGIIGKRLTFKEFVAHMQQQARASQRLRSLQERRRRVAAWVSP